MFTKSSSIKSFMKANNVTTAQLVRNPKTGKKFVTFGDIKARVNDEIKELSENLQVCWFTPEDGDPSWMVTKASNNVVDTLSL